jgi:hypothetical protein
MEAGPKTTSSACSVETHGRKERSDRAGFFFASVFLLKLVLDAIAHAGKIEMLR